MAEQTRRTRGRLMIEGAAAMTVLCLASAPARAQMEAAANGPASGSDPFSARNWQLRIHVYGGFDDNVLLVPDQPPYFDPRAEKGSAFAGISANGIVRFPVGRATTIGAAVRADRVQYFNRQRTDLANFTEQDDARDYSLTALGATAFLEQRLSLGRMPGRLGLSYSFRHERAKIEAIGLDAHIAAAYFQAQPGRRTILRASASYSWNDFRVDFRPIATRNRDGQYLSLDFSLSQRITPRQTLTLAAGYVNNDAGRDWDFHGWRVSAALATHISGPVYARFAASYTPARYRGGFTDIVPRPGRTSENLLDLSAGAYWYVAPHWVADLSYRYQKWDANLPQFEGERQRVTTGITWTY